jgi:hypothetical protein
MTMAKYGSVDRIKQMEIAAGISEPDQPVAAPATPVATPSTGGFVATPYTGIRPWAGESASPDIAGTPKKSLFTKATDYLRGANIINTTGTPAGFISLASIPKRYMMDRSTMGSPPFSKSELKQGYRKVGKVKRGG